MSDSEQKPFYRSRKRAAINEIILLFAVSWILCFAAKLLRLGIRSIENIGGLFRLLGGTLMTGMEIFVFAYILSRFFKQYKTACAFVIIAVFVYVLWAGGPHGATPQPHG
jgi:hypothetical protein